MINKKVLIFSGTTEGRILATKLLKAGVNVDVCVATEYGEQMMEDTPDIKVYTGRMDEEEIGRFISEMEYDVVVDATHPFATIVTQNIIAATKALDIPYIRVEREIKELTENENSLLKYFASVEECIEYLKSKTEGKILLTTGSKELKKFTEDKTLRKRIVARILPGLESLKIAYNAGLDGKQIIAMQGPFSLNMNENTIKDFDIEYLVTKESGKVGGMEEKLKACLNLKKTCLIIKKPDSVSIEKSYSVEEAYRKLVSPKNKVNISLVGIGMGEAKGLTFSAKEKIDNSDLIFGAKRMLESIEASGEKYPYYLEKDIMPVVIEKAEEKEIEAVVLFSGDTGFYSGCEKLNLALKEYDNVVTKIIPGASSLSYFAAKTGISYQDAKIVSTHGVSKEKWVGEILDGTRFNKKTFFITSGLGDIAEIAKIIENTADTSNLKIHIGYNLSYPDEKIETLSLEECKEINKEGLYVGLIINNNPNEKILTPGISDDEFIRDKVPMTKEEVRVLSICKLDLKPTSVVYDVGSGTGSIAIEMALLSPKIRVYAIEINPDAIKLIAENKKKFKTENIEIVEALAPDKFEELPVPTHAFIGGSKGNLKEILLALKDRNPKMRVVINAVSMETICEANKILAELGVLNLETTMVNVSKAKKLGSYNLMQAQNPVYIFSFNFTE